MEELSDKNAVIKIRKHFWEKWMQPFGFRVPGLEKDKKTYSPKSEKSKNSHTGHKLPYRPNYPTSPFL